jgi:hypothetical protein
VLAVISGSGKSSLANMGQEMSHMLLAGLRCSFGHSFS